MHAYSRHRLLRERHDKPLRLVIITTMGEPNCNFVEESVADAYESKAIARLQESGMRLTGPRRSVVRVLAETRKPLGAYQIKDRVGMAGGKIDVVSVYRILSSLVECGLAHHVGIVDGYLACPASHSGGHQTEHLVCESCGCVEEVAIPQSALIEIGVSGSRLGFLAKQTRVEVLGRCSHCR